MKNVKLRRLKGESEFKVFATYLEDYGAATVLTQH